LIRENTGSGQFGEPQNRVPANMRATYKTPKNTLNKASGQVFHGAGASKKSSGGACTAAWATPFERAK
jgi:hypothetical protein